MTITGLGYPLLTTGVAEILFHHQAEGSIITERGVAVGSELIGQLFTKPEYFHPRPSVTTAPDPKDPSKTIDQPYNAANSGASNLAPTSKKLVDEVTSRVAVYRKENGLEPNEPVPVDAVTASASGLDPDISVANARLQAKRVAAARGIPEEQVLALLNEHTQGPQYGVLGYPRVNVLELNIALDNDEPRASGK
jgi:K+-transporting ATPase ATPase C chain